MSTLSPTLVEMLIGAIPPQEGAALVARVGERARMTSTSGTVEVGSAPLTAEIFEALSKRLLPQEQLQTLQQTGSVEGQFVAPNGAGEFAVVANSTNDGQWIEVRRHSTTMATDNPQDASPAPVAPSVDTLVADLMSRTRSKGAASTAMPPKISAQPAHVPESVSASIPVEISTPPASVATTPIAPPVPVAPPVAVATPDLDLASSDSSNDDLTVPTNFDFVQSTFDPDDLSVSETVVGERAPSGAPARDRAPVAKAASLTSPHAARPTLTDRLSAYGRLSILLPAAILLGIGLPVVGWFGWTAYFPSAPAPAPTQKAIPRPTSPAVANVPQTAGGVALQARSKMPRVPMHAPSISAPSISLAAFGAPAAAAPAPSLAKEPSPAPVAPPNNYSVRAGFSVQVAAVRDRDEANRMVAKLVQQGYSGYVVNGEGAAVGFYRVRVGTFPNHEAAEAVANKIELSEGTKPWIVKETR